MITEGAYLLDGINRVLRCRFELAVQRADTIGLNVRVTSGFRTPAEQQALWDRWQKCRRDLEQGNFLERAAARARCRNVFPAARPGTSMHERGWAVDSVPVCTQRLAELFAAGDPLLAPSGGFSGPRSGPSAGGFSASPVANCTLLEPKFAGTELESAPLWALWTQIRREAGLWVPNNDRPHAEPCEFPELRRLGKL